MPDHITLLGAELVGRAGYNMQAAAERIERAVMTFDGAVDRLVRALDDHATRIEQAARPSPHSPLGAVMDSHPGFEG